MATSLSLEGRIQLTPDGSQGSSVFSQTLSQTYRDVSNYNKGKKTIAASQAAQAVPFGSVTTAGVAWIKSANNKAFTLQRINGVTTSIGGVYECYIRGNITSLHVSTGGESTEFEFIQAESS